jgi:hypothetical protein
MLLAAISPSTYVARNVLFLQSGDAYIDALRYFRFLINLPGTHPSLLFRKLDIRKMNTFALRKVMSAAKYEQFLHPTGSMLTFM